MPIRLTDAMQSMLQGWQEDLEPAWREVLGEVELGFAAMDPSLSLQDFEPVFPARKDHSQLGAATNAHLLRAFDDLRPTDVRCVLLGQDPYPCMAFSTGRAFDCGSYACWRDFDDLFTHSMRCMTQCIFVERGGAPALQASTAKWPATLQAIESESIALEGPKHVAQGWVDQGVLLLNSSLTISRFATTGDPHQIAGHLPLWRPLMIRVLQYLANELPRSVPLVLFGEVAQDTYQAATASFDSAVPNSLRVFATEHPAAGDAFLAKGNPLSWCNEQLQALGAAPIRW